MIVDENKLIGVLKSRKFWASLLGILASLGLYAGGEMEADRLVDAILVIVGTFTLGTGVESGLQALGKRRDE